MEMTIGDIGGTVTSVRLDGRLDAAAADAIGVRFTAAVTAQGRSAVIDLSQVSFIASMGIRLFIAAARALKLKGGKVVLYGAQDLVRNVLLEAAIDQILPVVDSEAQALASLSA